MSGISKNEDRIADKFMDSPLHVQMSIFKIPSNSNDFIIIETNIIVIAWK